MDCKKFAGIIRKSNSHKYRLTAAFILAGMSIALINSGETTSGVIKFVLCSAVMFLIISWMYIDSFMNIQNRMDKSLAGFLNFHGFDHTAYFTYVAKKLILVNIFMLLISVLKFMIFDESSRKTEIFIWLALLSIVIPYVLLIAVKKNYEYEIFSRSKSYRAVMIFIRYIFSSASMVIMTVFFALVLIIGLAVAGGNIADYDNMIAYKNDSVSLIRYVLLCCGIFCASLVFSLGAGRHEKMVKAVRNFSAAALIVLTGTNVYTSRNYYVLTTETNIMVCKKGNITEYSFDDVESFDFYYEQKSQSLELSVKTKDGSEVRLFGNSATMSDKYTENFQNTFEYGAYLAEKLISSGASGKIDDIDKLRSKACTSDQDRKGLDEIIAITVENMRCQ